MRSLDQCRGRATHRVEEHVVVGRPREPDERSGGGGPQRRRQMLDFVLAVAHALVAEAQRENRLIWQQCEPDLDRTLLDYLPAMIAALRDAALNGALSIDAAVGRLPNLPCYDAVAQFALATTPRLNLARQRERRLNRAGARRHAFEQIQCLARWRPAVPRSNDHK